MRSRRAPAAGSILTGAVAAGGPSSVQASDVVTLMRLPERGGAISPAAPYGCSPDCPDESDGFISASEDTETAPGGQLDLVLECLTCVMPTGRASAFGEDPDGAEQARLRFMAGAKPLPMNELTLERRTERFGNCDVTAAAGPASAAPSAAWVAL